MVTTTPYLFPAFRLLAEEKNLAVGAALVEALPDCDAVHQRAAIELLAERNHAAALAAVVGRFPQYDPGLQDVLVERIHDLFPGVRGAIASASLESRLGALELIARSRCVQLAYLLADALRLRCPRTREQAATVLREMTAHLLASLEADSDNRLERTRQVAELAAALRKAVLGWELHFQPKALEAALWMADRVEKTIREKLEQRRGRIIRPILDLLHGTSDPKMAGFALRALAMPPLRAAAARAVSRAGSPAFLRALVVESWVLCDPEVERGCKWIRDGARLQEGIGEAMRGVENQMGAAVRLLMATGGPADRKYEALREWSDTADPEIVSAVLWRLVSDESEKATRLLAVLAARAGAALSVIAARELQRRSCRVIEPGQGRAAAIRSLATRTEERPVNEVIARTNHEPVGLRRL